MKRIKKIVAIILIMSIGIEISGCKKKNIDTENKPTENINNEINNLEQVEPLYTVDSNNQNDENMIDDEVLLDNSLLRTVSAGIRSVALIAEDGSIRFFGDSYSGQSACEQWKDICSIETMGTYVVGLDNSGQVHIAGKGDCDIDVSDWKEIISIDSGEQYIIGLTSEGKVKGVGHNSDGQLNFENWNNIKLIASGWRHTVGITEDNKILVTGYNAVRQETILNKKIKENDQIVKVAAGGGYERRSGHTVVLKSDGTVIAAGDNSYGQCDVEEWSDIVDIAAGDWHTVGLKKDGTVVIAGEAGTKYKGKVQFEKWENVLTICAGRGFTIGLTKDGSILTAGYDKQNGVKELNKTHIKAKIYDDWLIAESQE